MKYLKLFTSHSDYNTAKSSLDKPNVSHCIEENEVHYNPWSWADEYLTFIAKENGTFTFTPSSSNVISYSTNGGETWIEGNSVIVSNGDKVMWKGIMTPLTNSGVGTFGSTGNFDIQGNAMSLLYGDNYRGQTNLTERTCDFYKLFYNNTKIVNAKNLSLPATTLKQNCYNQMFSGCINLVTAPKLPATTLAGACYGSMFKGCTSLINAPELLATTLVSQCYRNMFNGCTSLNYIKAMFTTSPNSSYTLDWVSGVASSGTFVKNSAATWTYTGVNGIPSGWTVQTASE